MEAHSENEETSKKEDIAGSAFSLIENSEEKFKPTDTLTASHLRPPWKDIALDRMSGCEELH